MEEADGLLNYSKSSNSFQFVWNESISSRLDKTVHTQTHTLKCSYKNSNKKSIKATTFCSIQLQYLELFLKQCHEHLCVWSGKETSCLLCHRRVCACTCLWNVTTVFLPSREQTGGQSGCGSGSRVVMWAERASPHLPQSLSVSRIWLYIPLKNISNYRDSFAFSTPSLSFNIFSFRVDYILLCATNECIEYKLLKAFCDK